jgi:hypothetical protein
MLLAARMERDRQRAADTPRKRARRTTRRDEENSMTRSAAIAGVCAAGLTVLGVVSASAGLSDEQFFADVSGGPNANLGATDVKIASGVVNSDAGTPWKLTITSANNGKLIRTAAPPIEIPYINITLVKTGGALGQGLTDPSGAIQSIAGGACEFTTGAQQAGTATVDYAFELRIAWPANDTLVAGVYADTIVMTFHLAN